MKTLDGSRDYFSSLTQCSFAKKQEGKTNETKEHTLLQALRPRGCCIEQNGRGCERNGGRASEM